MDKFYTQFIKKFIEKNHETMAKHEKMCILVSTKIKIPKGSKRIPSVDIVYYTSLKGVLNLSRKLTLKWTGSYWVISTHQSPYL